MIILELLNHHQNSVGLQLSIVLITGFCIPSMQTRCQKLDDPIELIFKNSKNPCKFPMKTAVRDAITLHEIVRKSNFNRENFKSIEVSANIEEAVIAGITTNERLYVATVGINEIFDSVPNIQ